MTEENIELFLAEARRLGLLIEDGVLFNTNKTARVAELDEWSRVRFLRVFASGPTYFKEAVIKAAQIGFVPVREMPYVLLSEAGLGPGYGVH